MQLEMLKKHTYGTRSLVAGDIDSVKDELAIVLIRLGIAKKSNSEETTPNQTRVRLWKSIPRVRVNLK